MIGITACGFGHIAPRNGLVPLLSNPMVPLVLLIVGSTGAISILLPYTAENYPVKVRGRATGWVAGCSKFGGLIAQS